MNNQKGFQTFRSSFKHPVSCSVCGQLNILTRNCTCRQHVLSTLPTKQVCEPLRLFGNPPRLVFDITITTDIFIVYVDPFHNQSKINGTMLQYLSILRRYPKEDNTVDVEFKFQNQRRSINCSIDFGMSVPISIGLSNLLNLGMQFSLNNSIVNLNAFVPINAQHVQLVPTLHHNLGFSSQPSVQNACCSKDTSSTHRRRSSIKKPSYNQQQKFKFSKNKKFAKNSRERDNIVVTVNNKESNENQNSGCRNKDTTRLSSTISRVKKNSKGDVLEVNVDKYEADSINDS